MKGQGFDQDFVRAGIRELVKAIDFLHTEVQCVHTGMWKHERGAWVSALKCKHDIHPGNLLLGLDDDSLFKKVEDNEISAPVERKELQDGTIYLSRLMKPYAGPFLLSDFVETLGNWGNFVPIPTNKTLEACDTKLEENTKFLAFIRRALTWDPEKRPTARELLRDPWLEE